MTPQSDPLAGLRDIHLPPPPGWWPPAPGWWVLAVLLALALGWIGWRAFRAWHRRRRLRRVLVRLDALARSAPDDCALVTGVAELLRRVALGRYPREQVAGLSGEAWLRFLDDHGGGGRFREGPGRVLADGPYRPGCEVDRQAVLRLARDWIVRQEKAS